MEPFAFWINNPGHIVHDLSVHYSKEKAWFYSLSSKYSTIVHRLWHIESWCSCSWSEFESIFSIPHFPIYLPYYVLNKCNFASAKTKAVQVLKKKIVSVWINWIKKNISRSHFTSNQKKRKKKRNAILHNENCFDPLGFFSFMHEIKHISSLKFSL